MIYIENYKDAIKFYFDYTYFTEAIVIATYNKESKRIQYNPDFLFLSKGLSFEQNKFILDSIEPFIND